MKSLKKVNSGAESAMHRHVPERTCVACHEVKPKRELVRLVCGPGGMVEVDKVGRRPGRGAYLCHSPECWNKGVNKGRLEHALRSRLSAESRARLMKFGGALREPEVASSRMGEVG
jgi:predicted RNA-binding protein YlxR (DUF448 family)